MKRKILDVFLTALVAVFLWPLFAPSTAAQGAVPCVETDAYAAAVGIVFPMARVLDLTGDDAGTYLARFNALPPRSEIVADRVVLVVFVRGPVLVAPSRLGFVCLRLSLAGPAHRQLMLDIERSKT